MIKRISNILAFSIVFLLAAIMIAVGYFAGSDDEPGSALTGFSFSGQYSADGKPWKTTDAKMDMTQSDIVILRGSFNCEIDAGEHVWLRLENAEVNLKINGKTVFSEFKEGSFPSMFHSPGYSWKKFISPGISSGDEIEITVSSYYGDSLRVTQALLDSLYYGDGSNFFLKIIQNLGFTGIISLIAFFVGFIYIIEGLLSMKQTKKAALRIASYGLYCFLGGLWALTDSLYPYFSFLFSPPWFAGIVDMLSMLLFPVGIAAMIRFYMRDKKTKLIMNIVFFSAVAVACVAVLLQLFGVCDLYQMQSVISIAAFIQLICAIVCLCREFRLYREFNILFLIFVTVPVFLAIILDGINFFLPFISRRVFMRYGLCISMIILTYQIISYAKAEKKTSDKLAQMEKELTDSRISIMLSQIQPHFLYNALGTIRALCVSSPETACKAIDHFSRYLRGNMDSLSLKEPVPICRDLEHLQNFMFIEKLRFDERLNVRYDLQTTDFLCPALTLQPLVENAIRHGLFKKPAGGTVEIRTRETESDYLIEIADDGVGFDPSAQLSEPDTHIGLTNTRKRLEDMCGGTLTVQSEIGKGSLVTVKLPKKVKV